MRLRSWARIPISDQLRSVSVSDLRVDQFDAALVDLKCFTGFPVRVDLFPCYERKISLLSDHYKIEKQYIIQFIIEHNPEI